VPAGPAADAIAEFDRALMAIEAGRGGGEPSLTRLNGELGALYGVIQGADVAPTTQALAAIAGKEAELKAALARWQGLRNAGLRALNAKLRAAGQPEIR
jgi:hypothetical protein